MPDITMIETYDSAMILNQEENEWEEGFLKVYKRHKNIQVVNGVTYTIGQYSYTDKIYAKPYSRVGVFARKPTPSSDGLYVRLQASQDGVNWYNALFEGGGFQEIILVDDVNNRHYRLYDIEAEYIRFAIYPDVGTMALWVDIILAT